MDHKSFSTMLCRILLEIFHPAYQHQLLPPSFVQSHTLLVPKSNDPDKLAKGEGHRPIALCNGSYKIYAKVLAHRLQHVVQLAVGMCQTCVVRERSTQTNTQVARSILESFFYVECPSSCITYWPSKDFRSCQSPFIFLLCCSILTWVRLILKVSHCVTATALLN